MKRLAATLAMLITASAAAFAQEPGSEIHLLTALHPAGAPTLSVSSPAFHNGGEIPRGAKFPGLSWSAGPPETKAYAIVVDEMPPPYDPDVVDAHWIVYNIPARITSLPAGFTTLPGEAGQGGSMNGYAPAYSGPRPPADGQIYRFHFQVFALAQPVDIRDPRSVGDIAGSMAAHVLATGEIYGTASTAKNP